MWMGLSCADSGPIGGQWPWVAGEHRAAYLWRRRRRARPPALLAVLGVAIGLVTACGSTPPEPRPTFAEHTPTSTPTPAPTPTQDVAPTRPAEMERTDEVGAAAAATYFMELYSYVLRTGDHTEWDGVGVADCVFCSGTREDVERIYGSGGRITGGEMTLGRPELLVFDAGVGVYALSVPYSFTSGSEQDASGDVVAAYEAAEGALVLEVIHSATGWLLVGGSQGEGDA